MTSSGWKTAIVDGQKVLVPVLYLAQTNTRNVRGSSLIQGRDLNLFTGGDLVNVGTLRASNDLNVQSAGSVYQGGLVEAGNDLQILAQDSIRNAMAGEIRASQVSLVALKGDIINDRTADPDSRRRRHAHPDRCGQQHQRPGQPGRCGRPRPDQPRRH